MRTVRKFVDRTLLLYVIVGVANFIICTSIMFLLFNLCGVSEHVAPIVNYGMGSLIWFLACHFILFKGHPTTLKRVILFAAEVLVCYLLSYYVIAPAASKLLLKWDFASWVFRFGGVDKMQANCEMGIGALAYALINYFGQRYIVFSDRFESKAKKAATK